LHVSILQLHSACDGLGWPGNGILKLYIFVMACCSRRLYWVTLPLAFNKRKKLF
jgi:hypothetical protein